MSTLTKTNNQRSLMRPWLRDFFDVENFFDGNSLLRPMTRSVPAVNVSENDKNFVVEVAAPGFRKEDFKVSVEEDTLTISAETKSEAKDENKEYSRREYNYSSFTRSFSLPENAQADNIGASYTDGVLKLSIPKNESRSKPGRTIQLNNKGKQHFSQHFKT